MYSITAKKLISTWAPKLMFRLLCFLINCTDNTSSKKKCAEDENETPGSSHFGPFFNAKFHFRIYFANLIINFHACVKKRCLFSFPSPHGRQFCCMQPYILTKDIYI